MHCEAVITSSRLPACVNRLRSIPNPLPHRHRYVSRAHHVTDTQANLRCGTALTHISKHSLHSTETDRVTSRPLFLSSSSPLATPRMPLLAMRGFSLLAAVVLALLVSAVSDASAEVVLGSTAAQRTFHTMDATPVASNAIPAAPAAAIQPVITTAVDGQPSELDAVTVEAERMLHMLRARRSQEQKQPDPPAAATDTAVQASAEHVVQQGSGTREVRPLDDAAVQSLRWPTEDAAPRPNASAKTSSTAGNQSTSNQPASAL